jgi:acyl carrier protein
MSPRWQDTQSPVLSKEGIVTKLQDLLKDILQLEDAGSLTPATRFQEDLGIASIDMVDMVIAIEDTFAIKFRDIELLAELPTLGDAAVLILERLHTATATSSNNAE